MKKFVVITIQHLAIISALCLMGAVTRAATPDSVVWINSVQTVIAKGAALSASVIVSNRSEVSFEGGIGYASLSVAVAINAPPYVFPAFTIPRLDPHQWTLIPLRYTVPSQLAETTYRFSVVGPVDSNRQNSMDTKLVSVVRPNPNLIVSIKTAPSYIWRGRRAQVVFRIHNTGHRRAVGGCYVGLGVSINSTVNDWDDLPLGIFLCSFPDGLDSGDTLEFTVTTLPLSGLARPGPQRLFIGCDYYNRVKEEIEWDNVNVSWINVK